MNARIVFLSPMCLLDRRSGAASTVRTWLEWLAGAGCECRSITLSVFDGSSEYPLARELGSSAAARENVGKFVNVRRSGVLHSIFHTSSTVGRNVKEPELSVFLQAAGKMLERMGPDIVISYGSSGFTRRLQAMARKRCGCFLFYLANANFTDPEMFDRKDVVVCPSEFLACYYRERLGLDPLVLWDPIDPAVLPEEYEEKDIPSFPDCRGLGFVTFINPVPAKGLPLFIRLARTALQERPEITFLAVEGRMSRSELEQAGLDIVYMPNVWWIPNQQDMRRIYRRSSIVLVPSFWHEASCRVVAEAQLNSLPVLAARRGGIPEQLNGGGFLFDIPARCTENYRKIPSEEEVRPWLDRITMLMHSRDAYQEAADRARAAARPFHPSARRGAVLEFFRSLV